VNEGAQKKKIQMLDEFLSALIIYAIIVNPSYILISQQSVTFEMIISVMITGLPFDITHAIATFFFLYFGLEPALRLIERAKIRYSIQ